MESTSARELDRRLADLVRSERHLVVQFVIELAGFAKRELYRELGYTSLFYYCLRQLGLSKSSAFRRSEVARLIARFPVIADRLAEGRVSIRALVELRDVLTDENHAGVLTRAEGKSQGEAQILAVEFKPRPIPRDVIRALPMPPARPASTDPFAVVSAETNTPSRRPSPPVGLALGPVETKTLPLPPEVVKPLTPELRRLNVTVTAEFIDELEQVRAALSHRCPDGDFEQVVREAFKLVLERDQKHKALTDRPRPQSDPQSETLSENDRYVPAAVKRTVWERDRGRCTWPMGDGEVCGTTHRLEFDHDLEVALGGKPTIGNIRLLCQNHNLMKAEQRLGRAFMAKFRKNCPAERDTS
jgi:5-methylcytosine-specific restriction endonuclease McrA